MTRPDPAERSAAASAAIDAADKMRWLDPGEMAALRRMTEEKPAAAYWRVAVKHKIMTRDDAARRDWTAILRILAILTPKGEAPPGGRPALHDAARALGRVLCDGGDPDWPARGIQPEDGVFSQRRLVQFLATRGPARLVALERAARVVAAQRNPASGIDVTQIAAALLWPSYTAPIAEAYFCRLDRVQIEETKA